VEHEAETRLAAATLRLHWERPYLAAALWAVQRIARPGLGTMATDARWRLYYDPDAVAAWTVEETAGVVYHELAHLVRDHAGRGAAAASPWLWNLAADAEINDDLRGEGVVLPGEPVTPATFGLPDGWLAEAYYRALLERPAPPVAVAGDGGEAGGGEGGGDDSGGDRDRRPGQGGASRRGRIVPGPGAGRCGSAATGQPEPWELGGARGAAGGGHDGGAPGAAAPSPAAAGARGAAAGEVPGVELAEAALIRRRVALDVQEHARGRGTLPGGWQRWAEAHLTPKVDWRRELAALVRHAVARVAGASDYSYQRLGRRQSAFRDVVVPALRQPAPRVAVVVDTSGSMGQADLDRALAEIAGILRSAGQREGLSVLAVDAAVHATRRVFRTDQVRLAGGGGTDMGVGIAAAARLRPRPEVVVVVTDGYTPWPARAPAGTRVVVALTRKAGSAPAWARAVVVDEATA
jgi:predicted metal-dependent peptidase